MIDLTRGQRETEIAARVDAFIRDVVIPYENDPRIGHHGPSDELSYELKEKARAAGLLSPHVGEEFGGMGLKHREIATVFRAAGYSMLGPVALNIMAPDEGNMALLEKVASAAQKEHFLRPLAAGRTRSAFFMTEPDGGAGSDPSMMKTTARQDGNHWVISGRKTLITGADGATVGIVMAKTEEGATLFLCDLPDPAIRIERVLDTIDRTMPGGHSVITIDGLRVTSDQVLGEVGQGFKYAQVRLAPARLTHCMRWWGAARRAHDIATAYAMQRHAFGKALIDHEGVGFMLADNLIDLKQAELMIDWCAWVLDNAGHGAGGAESSIAKVAVSEALFRIADRCVQILGGTGVTDDTPVHQIFRDIRAFRIYDGPTEVHKWSLAKKIKREAKASA
ncbi:MAG: acyl-CoA dehydrogenase family protein [Alphaproteobacteria bacterium]|nr:acyl-CoA dehydrogenase family protein [Alphaproteobacteria bacterium]